jgi:flavin reductase (DIM6/NTAB) family NADH-FMN oxidoreductase RutF
MNAGTVQLAVVPPGGDAGRLLRQSLGHFASGVTIVTTRAPDGRAAGLTVNSFASLSLEPPLLLWSLSNRSPNLAIFRAAPRFAINVLARGQEALARQFANPAVPDKFAGVALREGAADAPPLIAGSLAHFVCDSRDAIEAGDHTLFIGRVAQHAASGGEPLLFFRGAFGQLQDAQPVLSSAALC